MEDSELLHSTLGSAPLRTWSSLQEPGTNRLSFRLCTLAEDEFLECAHNEEVPEPTVACSECGRESHRACVGYTELFPDSVFVCKRCGGGKVPIDVNMMANSEHSFPL